MMHTLLEVDRAIADYRAGRVSATFVIGTISQAAFLCEGTDAEFCEECVIADVMGTKASCYCEVSA